MPRLILQFENRVLKEFPLGPDVTIGRLPDNALVIDNPAVSGHHARIFLEGERYVVEDLRSRNGTYVNEKHVIRQALQNGDVLLVGKHKLVFDEIAVAAPEQSKPSLPTLGQTAYLDTKKHRALLAKLREERARERAQAEARTEATQSAPVGPVAMLRVIAGRSDRSEYRLEHRTSFIGKSEAALVRLRGWFTPKAVAAIVQTDRGYDVTPMSGRVLINNTPIDESQALKDGDLLEFNGLVLRFHSTDQPSRASGIDTSRDPSTVERDGQASVA